MYKTLIQQKYAYFFHIDYVLENMRIQNFNSFIDTIQPIIQHSLKTTPKKVFLKGIIDLIRTQIYVRVSGGKKC